MTPRPLSLFRVRALRAIELEQMSSSASPQTAYGDAGVIQTSAPLAGLLHWVGRTLDHRRGLGEPLLGVGHYANIIRITDELGLALSTDGVGSKLLVAEMMGRYDTVGIDCIAMNANDLICVGAEPLALLDYIGVERADATVLEQVGRGLYEGAKQANITIPGGELAQLPEMIRGLKAGAGLDLVGACVGTVRLDSIIDGSALTPGDRLIGLASSGIHSNGLTLARKLLLAPGGPGLEGEVPGAGRSVGEELLEPTSIYVRPVVEMMREGLDLHALYHITGEGLLNLNRSNAPVGYRIDCLPDPQPIFKLIQRQGELGAAEMYRVFNMGVGFCIAVPEQEVSRVEAIASAHGLETLILGEAVDDPRRRVFLEPIGLVGEGEDFAAA